MNGIINLTPYTLSNSELTKNMESIRTALNTATKQANVIGKALSEIKNRELWKDDFKSFEECAMVFDIKKAQAYKLIQGYEIGELKLVRNGEKAEKLCTCFSNSQCVELVKLNKEEGEKGVLEALDSGMIKPTMTTKEIREAVDKHLNPEKYVEAEEAEEAEVVTEEVEKTDTPFDNMVITIENGEIKIEDNIGVSANDIDKIKNILKKYVK